MIERRAPTQLKEAARRDLTAALLFDFNGVLVDDEEQHCEALRAVLAAEGITLSRDQYYADYLGFNDRMCFLQAFRRAGQPLDAGRLDRLVVDKSRRYQSLLDRSLTLVPGAAEFVRRAAGQFRLAVVSGGLRREIGVVLDRIGLRPYFEVIVAAEDVERWKPDPAGLLLAHATLDRRRPVALGRCVVIEDSLPGLQAARAAGMWCAMLTTSHPATLLAEADVVWTSFAGHAPAELLELTDE